MDWGSCSTERQRATGVYHTEMMTFMGDVTFGLWLQLWVAVGATNIHSEIKGAGKIETWNTVWEGSGICLEHGKCM